MNAHFCLFCPQKYYMKFITLKFKEQQKFLEPPTAYKMNSKTL